MEVEQGAVIIKKPPVRTSVAGFSDITATGDNSPSQNFFFDIVFNPR